MRYKLLCVDLDGTLLDNSKKLSEDNKKAIYYAWEQGMEICIASGRSANSSKDILDALGIDGNIVALSGGQVVCHGKEIYRAIMPIDIVLEVLKIIKNAKVQAFLNNGIDSITYNGYSSDICVSYYREASWQEIWDNVISENEKISKISLHNPDLVYLEELRQRVLKINGVSVVKSDVDYLDIFIEKQSKWTGIEKILKHLNISSNECVCFGDNENDYEMIYNAGLGIAMDNAIPKVKEVANNITLSNADNGVAYGIKNLIFC